MIARLLTGSVMSVVAQGVTLVLALWVTPVLIGNLGKEDYGLWMLLIAIFGQYELLDFGLSLSMSRFFSKAMGAGDIEGLNCLVSTVFRVFISIAGLVLIGFALMWAFAPWWIKESARVADVRFILAVYGPVMALGFTVRLHQALLKAHLLYDKLAWISMLRQVWVGVLIYVSMRAGYGLRVLALILVSGILLELALICRTSCRNTPGLKISWSGFSLSSLREILGYSFVSFIIKSAHMLRSGIAPFIISGFVGLAPLALYSVGIRFIVFFSDVICSIGGGPLISAFSRLVGENRSQACQGLYLKSLRFAGCISMFGVASLVFYGDQFLRWWLGDGYHLSYQVMAIAAVPTAIFTIGYPAQSYLYAVAKHRALAVLFVVGGMANLLLSLLLVRWMGVLGVVWATVLETAVIFGYFLPKVTSDAMGVPLTTLYRAMLRGGGGALLLLAPFFALLAPMRTAELPTLVALGVAQCLYFLPLAWFSILTSSERLFLREKARACLKF